MADKQISDLTSASALTDGSLFVLEQAGAAMKANWGMMKNYISPGLANQYSNSATYNVGDYVIHNNQLYRCITAITTPESWTEAHWVSTTMSNVSPTYRGTLTSADDMNTLTDPGMYLIDYTVGYPANLPFDPHDGRVLVLKHPNTYLRITQMYFTNRLGKQRAYYRTSKGYTSATDAWNGVEWIEITTESTVNDVDTINGKRAMVPLIRGNMQSSGKYGGSATTTRVRPVNSYNDLFNFKLSGYKIKFYYYDSAFDFDEVNNPTPTNFLYTVDWQNIDDYVSPDRGMWFVFLIGKQGDGNISATDLAYIQENLEVYSRTTPSIYMQTYTVPYNATTYHAMWDSLVDGSAVRRILLGKVDNSDNYPIYAYEIHIQRNCLNENHNEIHYDGTNALYPRKKILIFAGQHGNEKCTPMDVFVLARELVKGGLQDIGSMFDWYIIPIVNPWGYSHVHLDENGKIIYRYSGTVASTVDATASLNAGIRENGSGMDTNRDFSDNTYVDDGVTYGWQTQETQIIKPYIMANKWDIFLDCHQNNRDKSTSMSTYCGAYCGISWETSADSDYNAKINKAYLTIDRACRNTNKNLSEYFRRTHQYQWIVLWQRTPCDSGSVDLGTAVNYMGGIPTGSYGNTAHSDIAADVSFTLETPELAWTYSQLSNQTNTPSVSWYNPIACTCSTTALCELIKSIVNSYALAY